MSIDENIKYIKNFVKKYDYQYVNIPKEDASTVFEILNGRIDCDYKSGWCCFYAGLYYHLHDKNISEAKKYYLMGISKYNQYAMYNYTALCNENMDQLYIMESEKGNSMMMNRYGQICMERGDYRSAEKYLKMAIEKGEESFRMAALNNYGIMCQQRYLFNEASKYFMMAMSEGNWVALNNYAYLCEAMGKKAEAKKYYLKGVQIGDIFAIENYGIFCDRMKDYINAEKYYIMALERRGNKKCLYSLLCILDRREKNIATLRVYLKIYHLTKDISYLMRCKKYVKEIDSIK